MHSHISLLLDFSKAQLLISVHILHNSLEIPLINAIFSFYIIVVFLLSVHLAFFFRPQCEPISGLGFRRGSYKCICRKGFYFPDTNLPQYIRYFNGSTLEEEYEKLMLVSFICVHSFNHLFSRSV